MTASVPSSETRWWWVRHAPIAAPNQGLINGQRDVAADVSDGARLARLAAAIPQDAHWLASPLVRTHQTAAALGRGMEGVSIEPAFAEQHFGDWQGLTWDEVASDGQAAAFWADPGRGVPPGGENFAEQIARVGRAVGRIGPEHAGGDVVVVAHAGTIRAALAGALGLEAASALSIQIETLSLSRIDQILASGPRRGGGWRVACVNRLL